MPRIYNKRTDIIPKDAIYCGRPGPFGNPFRIRQDSGRAEPEALRWIHLEVVTKYRDWLLDNPPLMKRIQAELRGKDLVCWCVPLPCHCEVILEAANPEVKAKWIIG